MWGVWYRYKAKNFYREVADKCRSHAGRPSACTPYWSHSLADYLVHVIGKTFFISYTLGKSNTFKYEITTMISIFIFYPGLHKDIRRRALRKAERERANAKKE